MSAAWEKSQKMEGDLTASIREGRLDKPGFEPGTEDY